MRVLFVGPLPPPVTGQSIACQALLDALRTTDGVEVDVINLSKRSLRQGIDSLERLKQVALFVLDMAVRQRAADVVYFTTSQSVAGNLKDLVMLATCARRLSSVVIHLHGGTGMRQLLRDGRRALRALNSAFLKRIGAAVVLGGRLTDVFAGLMPRERIHIVPNFAEDALFIKDDTLATKFPTSFTPECPLRLVFLSNHLPGKGHIELVSAAAMLPAEDQARIHLDFAGAFQSESEQHTFERHIAKLEHVTYHGVMLGEEKRHLLHRAHILCLPTYYAYEGQPIAILEGYAAGCAVITTDHGGIFDVFEPGKNGFAVPQRSAERLRDAILEAARSPTQLGQMALANCQEAKDKYQVSRNTSQLIDLLRSVSR